MSIVRPILAALVLLSPAGAAAQEPPAGPPVNPPPLTSHVPPVPLPTTIDMLRGRDGRPLTDRNVRVDVVVTIKGTDKPMVKSLSMVAGDGRQAQGRGTVNVTVARPPWDGRASATSASTWTRCRGSWPAAR